MLAVVPCRSNRSLNQHLIIFEELETIKNTYGRDLTEGHVFKQLASFALPFLLSNLLQAMYSVVDLFIVGKYIGPTGISAVNISGQVMMIISSLIIGFSVGGNVIVAQFTGAHNSDGTKKAVGTLFTIFLIIAAVMTVFGLTMSDRILSIVNTPEEAFGQASGYLKICSSGIIFIFGYNAVSAVLRGLGDSKRPLYFVLIAAVINAILDYIFVAIFEWGVNGAAIATVIAQTVSFLLCVITLKRSDFIFDFKWKSFKIDKGMASRIIKLGTPSSVQMTLMSASFLFLSSIVNEFGVPASAAFGIGSKVDNFAIMPALAISSAVSSMVGQNIGAGKPERARHTLLLSIIMSLGISIIVFIVIRIFSADIIKLFIKDLSDPTAPETIAIGTKYLSIVAYSYLIFAFMFQFNGLATGSGHTLFTLLNVVLTVIVARIPISYLLAKVFDYGVNGVFIAMTIAPLVGTVSGIIFYLSGKWKRSKLIKSVEDSK